MYHTPALVPFYLVVDVSQSMEGPRLAQANQILRKLAAALSADPRANDKVRICMIDFSGSARVVLPLCDLLNTSALPTLKTRDDGTRYSPALDLLLKTINQDGRQLAADGFAVGRPAAFFLSDGEPFDDAPNAWEQALGRLLTTCENPPMIVPCAIAESDPATLRALAHPRPGTPVLIQSADARPEDAINALIDVVIRTVLSSADQETAVFTQVDDLSELQTVIAEPPEEWLTETPGADGRR